MVIQMTKIYLSDVYLVHPQFLKTFQSPDGEIGVRLTMVTFNATQGRGLVARGTNHGLKRG